MAKEAKFPPKAPEVTHVEEMVATDAGRLSLWQLMKRRFLRSRLAVAGTIMLALLYVLALFADFAAPYSYLTKSQDYVLLAPQLPRFVDAEGRFHVRPFVYGIETVLDTYNLRYVHKPDPTQIYPIEFFVRGPSYKLFGLISTDLHLFGVQEPGTCYILGTDRLGQDLWARTLHGSRVSLTIGLVGVALTIVFGSSLGTASGFYGGLTDTLMQRGIEILMSFPQIPLWAAFAAAVPPEWSTMKRYFALSVILSLVNWTGLARQVRAKVLSYREMDYAVAAKLSGASDWRIIMAHLMPNALSHIIVVATLSIPGMILAETSLSFLGLGIQPPMVSWGVLLQDATNVTVIVMHPWLLIPGIFVVVSVLAFNFVGDGLRDAADPFAI
jgi:peptide/nickel transport system permease protein